MKPTVCNDKLKVIIPVDTEDCEFWLVPVKDKASITNMDRNHAWITRDNVLYVFDGNKLVGINDPNTLKVKWGNVIGNIAEQHDLYDILLKTIWVVKQNGSALAFDSENHAVNVNVPIMTIKVNGVKQDPKNYEVNIDLSEYAKRSELPKKLSELVNDTNFISQEQFDSQIPIKSISYNGKILTPDSNKNVDINFKLSDYISAQLNLKRDGKIYQTALWNYDVNPTSLGEKLSSNKNLVCEPSTATVEGRDDYADIPLFQWWNCNYVREDDGFAIPTAMEGDSNYGTTGNKDVGVLRMTFWYSVEPCENGNKTVFTISDSPHEGLQPWEQAVRKDGTVMPYFINSKYISGIASDGKLRSQPNLPPKEDMSYNNMHELYQQKGKGYYGASIRKYSLAIIDTVIKYGTKNTQDLLGACSEYNWQYTPSIKSSTKLEHNGLAYFPLTNVRAEKVIIGSGVCVGYSSDRSWERDNDSMRAYGNGKSVKVVDIFTIDADNKGILLDTEPFQTANVGSEEVVMSSYHWFSGSTDEVIGHHDGAVVIDQYHPTRINGVEYFVGGYVIPSDCVITLGDNKLKTVYVANREIIMSGDDSSQSEFESTYQKVGNFTGRNGYIGDVAFNKGVHYITNLNASSSTGYGDLFSENLTAYPDYGVNKMLLGGHLANKSNLGLARLLLDELDEMYYSFLSSD